MAVLELATSQYLVLSDSSHLKAVTSAVQFNLIYLRSDKI